MSRMANKEAVQDRNSAEGWITPTSYQKTFFLIKRKWCWCCNEQKIKQVIVSALVILSALYCTRVQNLE